MLTKKNNMISKSKLRLIFCSFVPVGLEDYVQYFRSNFDDFSYLRWKFPHSKGSVTSSLIEYSKGNLQKERILLSSKPPKSKLLYFIFLPLNYLLYFSQALTSYFKRKSRAKVLFIGENYFCTFCGIILKKIGSVDYVIYRVMDFFPLPPQGVYRYLNRLFYVIDKFCLDNSDYIWFTTEGHIIGRERYGYFKRSEYKYEIIPLGLDSQKFVSKAITEENRYSLVYCGVISKYHMLDLLFDVIKELNITYPKIRLNLIGSGPDEEYFKDLCQKMGLQDNIIFHGFLEEGDLFRELVANNILGIAFYRDEENFMKYTEPAKVKYFLSYGVPSVVSKVPLISFELSRKRVCFAVRNDKNEIVDTIRKFLSDASLQQEYKKNVTQYVKTVDIKRLLDETIERTFLGL